MKIADKKDVKIIPAIDSKKREYLTDNIYNEPTKK